MIKYSQLTDRQKKAICNGCGGKGGFVNPPEFLFNASCNQHDFYYWRGGNEDDRLKADNMFYEAMKEDVKKAYWYLKPHYTFWAYAYYKAVRLMGKKFFSYGLMKNEDDLIML